MLVTAIGFQDRNATAFLAIAAAMVVLAVGQLFVLPEIDSTTVGLPLWVWTHLAVLVVLLAMAWIATGFVIQAEGR